jgi:hypothetical protein
MSNTDDAASARPPGKPRRPGPTIDLQATEIESAPAQDPNAGAASAPPDAQTETTVKPDDRGAEQPAGAPPPRRSAWAAFSGAAQRFALPLSLTAGLLGGVAAAAVVVALRPNAPADDSARVFDMRLIRIEQQVRELTDRAAAAPTDPKALEELAARIAKLETALSAVRPSTDPALANRIAAIEGEVKAMAETVSVLGRRNDDIAALAGEARRRADANAAAIAELQKKLAALGASPVVRSEFDALAERLAAAERAGQAIATELTKRPLDSDRAGRLAVVAGALGGALERGEPFAAELAALKSLGADAKALAPLEPFAASGLPTASALGREFAVLVPALHQAAGVTQTEGATFLERLQANAEKLVRIRPVAEVPGNDASAIIARAEVKASRNDLAGALDELAKLPASARAPAEDWIKRAQARSAALAAGRRLASDSLAALGK